MRQGGFVLEGIPLFKGLASEDLEAISNRSHIKQYRKNTIIFNQGDESDSLYILLSGRLKVFVSDDEGKEVILGYLEPLEYVGELALIDNEPRSASVITLESSRLSRISQSDFSELLKINPQIPLHIMATLARRTRALASSVESLALLDVYGRTARVLLQEATEKDGVLITGKLTHQDIANMVGSSREMVSRIIKELRQGGYITVREKQIRINQSLPAKW